MTSCSPPSEAFEAQSAKEFGDEVVLNTTTGNITSLTVDFQSYACSTSGHWNLGASDACVTTGTPTFSHDITANIYAKSTSGLPGALLGTVTQTFTDIPYRPTADPTNCPGGAIPREGIEAGSQWFNPTFGTCQYSISKLLTFTFAGTGIAVPSDGQVIWTVAFTRVTTGTARCVLRRATHLPKAAVTTRSTSESRATPLKPLWERTSTRTGPSLAPHGPARTAITA